MLKYLIRKWVAWIVVVATIVPLLFIFQPGWINTWKEEYEGFRRQVTLAVAERVLDKDERELVEKYYLAIDKLNAVVGVGLDWFASAKRRTHAEALINLVEHGDRLFMQLSLLLLLGLGIRRQLRDRREYRRWVRGQRVEPHVGGLALPPREPELPLPPPEPQMPRETINIEDLLPPKNTRRTE